MDNFFLENHKFRIIWAAIGIFFHGITVVFPLMWYWGKGENSGGFALLIDFPLFLLANAIPSLNHLIYTSRIGAIWYFIIGGTTMYAGVGWVIGFLLDRNRKTSITDKT